MSKILIIGDVHGKVNQYQKILKGTEFDTVQLGDFGFQKSHTWHTQNIDPDRHKVLFGNHDDYNFLLHPHSLGDYCCNNNGIMFVRGAHSYDKNIRVARGWEWFNEEELDYEKMSEAVDLYEQKSPRVMVTHDCPQSIRERFFGIREKTSTSNDLEVMLGIHKPDLWIFRHHHRPLDTVCDGVRFMCLGELETFLIET